MTLAVTRLYHVVLGAVGTNTQDRMTKEDTGGGSVVTTDWAAMLFLL